ncbi:unnamed protein product [Dovyalis caffra]|uniref:Uncharacterized protein n=1 Tax=Dovyalis caffra TaxID=77055 RepID=A0AAV1RGA5_9ROSI|nr:unnamed protein product [Dovyalis caffra]
MAGTPRATFTFLSTSTILIPLATPHRFRLKPLLASTTSTPFPPKHIKRKNHLRLKILKTLTKPLITAPLPLIERTPLQNDTVYDTPLKEVLSNEELDADKVEEFQVSETVSTAGEYSGNAGKFSVKSVLKFSGYFIGVLLFQTICVVWLFGNTDSDGKERKFNNLDKKGNVLLDVNGNDVYANESELEEKINEIKVMAREVRERERRELIEGNKGSELEKEIDVIKLEKRLNSKREKLPDSIMEYLGLFGDGFGEDGLDLKEENKTLMFKKKFRFKSPSMDVRSTPKGFSDLKDKSVSSRSGSDPNGVFRKNDVGSVKKDSGRKDGNVQLNSVQNKGNKLEKERVNLLKEMGSGAVQETRKGRSSNEVPKAGKSRVLETLNSESLTKEDQGTTIKFDRPAALSRNGGRGPGKRQVANKVGDKQSDVQKDLWWLNLPYVLAILMRRGSEHEESGGLYSLRVASQEDEHRDFSYTVAFEDRADANNFCYLLESFFEGLGDFSADIVPLQVKELHEAVKSHSKKVIVVKKGQLKLYVGQPFSEVEIAFGSNFRSANTIHMRSSLSEFMTLHAYEKLLVGLEDFGRYWSSKSLDALLPRNYTGNSNQKFPAWNDFVLVGTKSV